MSAAQGDARSGPAEPAFREPTPPGEPSPRGRTPQPEKAEAHAPLPSDQAGEDKDRPQRGRARVEIEYCTQCRWLPRAAWLAQELLGTFELEVGEVALVPGTGGVFVVRVDGEVVWDRRTAGFPEPSALKRAVRDRVAPGRPLGHADR